MAATKPANTDTHYTVRYQTGATSFVEIHITGTGLKYDPNTGLISDGDFSTISLSDFTQTGKNPHVQLVSQLSGLGLSFADISKFLGGDTWSDAKFLAANFSSLIGVTATTSYSEFSRAKSFTFATELSDHINGSKFADDMVGNGGNDTLNGCGGKDKLDGGKGDDVLGGGGAADFLTDKDGNNQLSGGSGNDSILAGLGDDKILGGKGDDVLFGHGGRDAVSGGLGRDVFVFNPKDAGALTITDFGKGDILLNFATYTGDPSGDSAYADFMAHARQVDANVVYTAGTTEVILLNTDINSLSASSFAQTLKVDLTFLF